MQQSNANRELLANHVSALHVFYARVPPLVLWLLHWKLPERSPS